MVLSKMVGMYILKKVANSLLPRTNYHICMFLRTWVCIIVQYLHLHCDVVCCLPHMRSSHKVLGQLWDSRVLLVARTQDLLL